MTIDELLSLAGLTANDEIPVWDAEAVDEPTKKITAQNMAASVKALAGLVGEAEFTEALADKASAIVDTASGAIASFPDGAAVPAKDITIAIEPVQAGSGAPSPTNVRPISGWTGAKVANISDSEKQPYFAGLLNGTYGFVDLGTLDWTVMTSGNVSFFAVTDSRIKPATGSRLIPNVLCSQYATVSLYDAVYTSIDKIVTLNDNSYNVLRIKDTSYTDAATFKAAMSGVYLIYELATPATPTITPEQYNQLLASFNLGGWLIPISWQSEAGSVYGGTLDVTTGLLTVTMAEVDLGTLDWEYSSAYAYFYATVSDLKSTETAGVIPNWVCSLYTVVYARAHALWAYAPDKSIGARQTTQYVCVKDSAYSNAASFKAAMSGVQFVYELATPQTYQLTPVEIEMLLGDNNVWADTGDSTVTYRADTKLYIQKINAPTDDDMIADAQIASGRYFIVGGNLYKSTTTIPAGDTINPGSNCILTNLADALNALNT